MPGFLPRAAFGDALKRVASPADTSKVDGSAHSAVEAPPELIRVLVADDTATVRLLLRRTLESSKAFEVVGEAADGAQAVDMAESLQPDIVLLDLSMPVLGGMEAIPRIRRCAPDARVVVLSGFAPDRMGSRAVEVGASAFLEKQQRPNELIASLLQTWKATQPAPPAFPPAAERFRQAFEHAPLGTALVDGEDRVMWANPAWCRMTGRSCDELAALTVADLTHPEDREAAAAGRRSVLQRTAPSHVGEARLSRPDGRTLWASMNTAACDDGVLVVQLYDVTDQKRTERDLTRSNAELSSFAFLAAHELKSPLQTLSGFAALLERTQGPQLDVQGQEFVRWIVDGVTRMDAVIEDLLAYCSVDADELALAPVAVGDVLVDALNGLEWEIERRRATISADPLPVVTADPLQLAQLLQNLLTNALKFVPEGRPPQIHVSAERGADSWMITVADNGIGVEDGARERIFTMFERLHSRERYKGTGIGLSICKRIVERWGGTIWVEANPGGGSRFRFAIPDILTA
jgi:PAS domain S-box-containing protein